MENRTVFASFIDERTTSLTHRIWKAEHKLSNERIRRARVGLKRWRTLYQLIGLLIPQHDKGIKVEEAVHRLFKRAGKLRDYQQTRQQLTDLKLPANLEKKVARFLKKREKKARKRLKKALRAFPTGRLKKLSRFVGAHNRAIGPTRVSYNIQQLMEQEARAIDVLRQHEPSVEEIHSIRKHLKSLIELSEVLMAVTKRKKLVPVVEETKQMQTQLGNWHDQISLVAQFNHYLAKHPKCLPSHEASILFARYDKALARKTKRIRKQLTVLTQLVPALTPWKSIRSSP